MPIFSPSLHLPHCDAVRTRMARLKFTIITAIAIVGGVVALVLLYQARAGLRLRDEQLQRLRDRLVQLEDERPHFVYGPVGPHGRRS